MVRTPVSIEKPSSLGIFNKAMIFLLVQRNAQILYGIDSPTFFIIPNIQTDVADEILGS